MEEPLSLLVRSPAQRHRDLRLSAEPAWTVRRLKTELRRLLPDAPVSARSPLRAAPPGGSLRAASLGGWLAGWWGLAPRGAAAAAALGLSRGSGTGTCPRGCPGPGCVSRAWGALGLFWGWFVARPRLIINWPPGTARSAGVWGRQSPLAPGSSARAPHPAGQRAAEAVPGALEARSR